MAKVSARPLHPDISFPSRSEVVGLEYTLGKLSIRVQGIESTTPVVVEFNDTIGFRVLDESNLNEYWPECSTPNGGLFEITAGGWLSQEACREGSLISATNPKAREYLITGQDDCVSVICRTEPVMHKNAL